MTHFPDWKPIRAVLLSPWLIAALVTLFLVSFLGTETFQKHRLALIAQGGLDKRGGYEHWIDLNRDGNSERVVLFNNTEGKASVKIIGLNGYIGDHFYFDGEIIPDYASLAAGPVDSSGRVGVFVITERNDSLMLQGFLPVPKREVICKDLFIAVKDKENGKRDFNMNTMLFTDLDRDGHNEVVITLLAGFRLQPRMLSLFNTANGTLISTPLMGAYYFVSDTADVDGDGFQELLFHSYAIWNYSDTTTIPYDDHHAWLMILDRDLKFTFPPVGYKKKYLSVTCKAWRTGEKMRIVALYNTRTPGAGAPRLMVFDHRGNKLHEKILDDTSRIRNYSIYIEHSDVDHLWLIREGGVAEEFDSSLNSVKKKVIPGLNSTGYLELNLDEGPGKELVFYGGEDGRLIVTTADIADAVDIELGRKEFPSFFDVIREVGKPVSLFVQKGDYFFRYAYEKNPWYYLRWLVYPGIFCIVLGFIFFIQYIHRKTLKQRYRAEKEVVALQLKLLNNQLDPHFTFNAINSISASILRDNPEEANRNLINLSKLMRSCVTQSEKLSRSLAEELDFLQNYIELLHCRMENSFEYRLEVTPEVDLQWQVLRMVTQIYAENAIKHGLKPLAGGGILTVHVTTAKKNIVLEVQDNGIGRKRAGANGTIGTGKGISIVDQAVAIINKYNRQKISVTVHDLTSCDNLPAGTLVRLEIPVGLQYNFF